MADGPGKYDMLTTLVRDLTGADAVVVLVAGGIRGTGFDVQIAAPPERQAAVVRALADALRAAAAQMDQDAERLAVREGEGGEGKSA